MFHKEVTDDGSDLNFSYSSLVCTSDGSSTNCKQWMICS